MGKTTDPVNYQEPTPEQLRADLVHTRAELTRTLDEIHGKLNPTVLKQQALEQFEEARQKVKEELREDFEAAKARFKEEAQEAKIAVREATIGRVETMYHSAQDKIADAGHSMVEGVKANPIPYALIGAGLGWLFLSRRRARRSEHGVPERRELLGGTGEAVEGTASKIGELASEAKAGVESKTGQVAERVGQVAHDAKAKTQDLVHRASDLTQRKFGELRSRTVELFESNPLAVGAGLFACGAAIGMAIPSTRRERQLLGGAGEGVIDKARSLAQGAIGKVEERTRQLGEGEPQPGQQQEQPWQAGTTQAQGEPASEGEPAPEGEPDREGPEGGRVIPPPLH